MTQELPFANYLQVPFIFVVYYETGGFWETYPQWSFAEVSCPFGICFHGF
jgi:hypothetical protein